MKTTLTLMIGWLQRFSLVFQPVMKFSSIMLTCFVVCNLITLASCLSNAYDWMEGETCLSDAVTNSYNDGTFITLGSNPVVDLTLQILGSVTGIAIKTTWWTLMLIKMRQWSFQATRLTSRPTSRR